MDQGLTPHQQAASFPFAPARTAGPPASHRQERTARLHVSAGVPLVLVLVVQALLSIRLVRADTAFQDEAAYIWAGHLELAHWLHSAAIPPFPSYFSGAPVIYPPLAAIADNIGGLTAARILSLAFMLGATTLLWDGSRRLFGRQAAFFAAALFAVLGPTLHLGAFATYDAMSVLLIALACWLVIRAGDRPHATGWMIATGVVLALANATAYSSTLFDVIVVLIALLIARPALGLKVAATRCLTAVIVIVVLLAVGWLIGGNAYLTGFDSTTLQRAAGTASASTVLADAWVWTGVIVVAALCGVVISVMRREPPTLTWVLGVMTAAALLGPLEQAQLRTAASLDKHVGLGAWFASIAAGYAVDKLIVTAPAGMTRIVTCGACVVALALPVAVGASQSRQFSANWPNSADFVAIFRPLVQHSTGPMLVEDPSIAEYYIGDESQWMRWSSTRNIVLPGGKSSGGPSSSAGVVGAGNAGAFGTKIEEHYFKLVALNYIDTHSLDLKIDADLKQTHHYCVIQIVPYGMEIPPIGSGNYVIWRYDPQQYVSGLGSTGWNCT